MGRIKRPLVVSGAVTFTALGCFYFCNLQNGTYIIIVSGILAMLSAVLCKLRHLPNLCVAVTVPLFLFSCLYFGVLQYVVLPASALQGCTAEVVAEVLSAPQWNVGDFVCRVQTQSIGLPEAPQNVTLLLRVYELEDVAVGDTLRANVTFYSVDRVHYTQGVYIAGYTQRLTEVASPLKATVFMWAEGLRQTIRTLLQQHLPTDLAGFGCGLLLGDKSALPLAVEEAYRVCGLSHLLAVSGLHLGLLAMAFLRLMKWCRCPRRLAAALCILFVLCLVAAAGFTGSVMRAGAMYILVLSGRLLCRRSDPLNSLGGAVLFLLALQPTAVGNLSLLLSFTAVAGILILSPPILTAMYRVLPLRGWCGKLLRGAGSAAAVSLAAAMGTLPVQILCFGQFSLLTLPANLLICGVASLVLVLLAVLFLLASIVPVFGLADFLFALLSPLLRYCTNLPQLLSQSPFAMVYTQAEYIFLCVGLCFILLAASLLGRPYGVRSLFCGGLCVLLICCSSFTYRVYNHNVAQITVISSAAGCSTVITQNQKAVVIGLPKGTPLRVDAFLQSQGVHKIDTLILPASTQYQAEQVALLRQRISIERLLCADEQTAKDVPNALPVSAVQSLQPWEGSQIVFYPHNYGNACRVQLGQKVCFITAAGLDYTPHALSIGAVDLVVCNAALPKGLVTRPTTAYFLGQDTLATYLAANRLQESGALCYLATYDAKTVAKWYKNGYSKYSYSMQ